MCCYALRYCQRIFCNAPDLDLQYWWKTKQININILIAKGGFEPLQPPPGCAFADIYTFIPKVQNLKTFRRTRLLTLRQPLCYSIQGRRKVDRAMGVEKSWGRAVATHEKQKIIANYQDRNYEGRKGISFPWKLLCPYLQKCVGHSFWTPLNKFFASPCVPIWLGPANYVCYSSTIMLSSKIIKQTIDNFLPFDFDKS